MIWEAVNQKMISDGYQIHHRDSNRANNVIDNLELVTRQENMIYVGKQRRGKTPSKSQNVPIQHDISYQHPIYTNYSANEMGQIYNEKTNRVSIGNLHPSGYLKTTLNQIELPKKSIMTHRLIYECIEGQIPTNYEINHIDSNRQNNCIYNLEAVTHSENMKHAAAAKK